MGRQWQEIVSFSVIVNSRPLYAGGFPVSPPQRVPLFCFPPPFPVRVFPQGVLDVGSLDVDPVPSVRPRTAFWAAAGQAVLRRDFSFPLFCFWLNLECM